ncbi:MAG: ZIP family metal transporter [Lewinella sp.]
MVLWQYGLLLISALLGGALALLGSERYRALLPSLLSFSGAYLLGIAALELIPEVFGTPVSGVGLWLLLGFFIQLLLEGFSQGVEHGHVHAHKGVGLGFALRVMVGLGLHALLEGLPLGTDIEIPGENHDHGEHLLFGIVLHKLPAAFALALLLRGSGYTRSIIWSCLAIFGLLTPLGAVLGDLLSIDPVWRARILALVVGSFLHISTTILFEADGSHSHGISIRKFLIIVAGMGVAYLTAH